MKSYGLAAQKFRFPGDNAFLPRIRGSSPESVDSRTTTGVLFSQSKPQADQQWLRVAFDMSRRKMESRTSHKAGKPSHRGANGYIHVAKPATASEILRAWGISQAHAKRLLQGLKFAGSES